MKVLGQLEGAQLENYDSTPGQPTPVSTGRMYADVRNPLAALPMFYDGSSWRTMAFAQVNVPLVTQNSGKSVTVDWGTGLNQKVVLTDGAVIRFTNPIPGAIHTLVVQQTPRVSGSINVKLFPFTFDMPDQSSEGREFQPAICIPAGFSRTFTWFYNSGIIPAYTRALNPQYAVSLGNINSGIAIHPDGSMITAGFTASPYTGWVQMGTRNQYGYTSPSNSIAPTAASSAVTAVAFHPTGNQVYYALASTPFIAGISLVNGRYPNPAAGFMANPASLPPAAGSTLSMHPMGNHIALGHGTSPYLTIYHLGGGASGFLFDVKCANPATLPVTTVQNVAFSPHGDYVTVTFQSSPYMYTYAFDSVTSTIGAVVVNSGPLPGGNPTTSAHGIAWRPQGDFIAIRLLVSPYLYVIPFNRQTGAYGTPLTVPTLPSAERGVCWSPCGSFLAVANGTSSQIYQFNGSTFTLVSWDSATPTGTMIDCQPHPDGERVIFLAAGGGDGYWTLYWPQVQKNYIRLN